MSTPLNLAAYELALAQVRTSRSGFIRRGSGERNAVKALQHRLSDLGYGISTDGVFGQETEKALRQFQQKRKAKVDGIVGPETLGKLERAKRGKVNPADPGIDAIQKVVGTGQRLPGTSATGRGLGNIAAQQHGGGTSTAGGNRRTGTTRTRPGTRSGGAGATRTGPHGGSIDPLTGKEMATSKTGPIGSTKLPGQANNQDFESKHPRQGGRFVAKGDSGEQVTNTQQALNHNGYKLKTDGEFGIKTQHAVRSFQRRAGIQVDGIVGPQTSQALRQHMARPKRPRRTAA